MATCRQPQHAEELGQLAEQHPETLYVARFYSESNLSHPTDQPMLVLLIAEILLNRLDVTDLDSFTVFSETV